MAENVEENVEVAKSPDQRPEFNSGEKITAQMEDFLLNLDREIKQEFLYLIKLTLDKINIGSNDELKLAKQLRNSQNLRYSQINQILEAETNEFLTLEKLILSEKNVPTDPNISDSFKLMRNPLYQAVSYTNSYSYEIKHNRYFLYKHFDTILSYLDTELLLKWDRIVRAYTNDPDYFINKIPEDSAPPEWPDDFQTKATGDNKVILETIKQRESGGNYGAKNPQATASGAYQYIDGTWINMSKAAWNDEKAREAIIKGFEDKKLEPPKSAEEFINLHRDKKGMARHYPPRVQDAVADYNVTLILNNNKNNVETVPLVWYTGSAKLRELTAQEKAVNKLSPKEYVYKWMATYDDILKNNRLGA